MKLKKPDSIDAHVGSCIRLRRKMLSVTQGKLADHLGVSFQQVQKYENGVNRVGASRLQKIADFLKVPVSFFFLDPNGTGKVESPAKIPSMQEAMALLDFPEAAKLNKAFLQIKDPNVRAKVVALLETLAGEVRI